MPSGSAELGPSLHAGYVGDENDGGGIPVAEISGGARSVTVAGRRLWPPIPANLMTAPRSIGR